jgi:Fe-S cluster assembly protein SufD
MSTELQIEKPKTLHELREKAAAAFASAPDAAFKYGLNVFFSPKDVALPFGDASAAKQSEIRVPEGVTALSFADALARENLADCVLKFLSAADQRPEKIVAWHRSQSGLGTFIVIPPHFTSDKPIRIDLAMHDARRVENILIVAGEGSRVTVIEHLRSTDDATASLRSAVTDIIVNHDAHVTHISLQDFADNVTDLSLKRATVKRNGRISWVECVFGSGYGQSIVATELTEEGASADAKTQFFGRDAQKFDLFQSVRHLASHTRSELHTRGALMGAAKTVYRGLVRIEKGTRGCVGHQKEDTLLLGDKAEIDAVPKLEIETDDVRCGHSASAGRIDKDKLFYLMSRGLDEPAGRKLLVEGFFAPIVKEMRDAGLRDRVQCIIDERIAPLP